MLLDMHIVHALENGWVAYRDDIAAFNELFPTVSNATLASWHAVLVAEPPVFRVAHAPGTPEAFPMVTVELLDETPTDRYLGKSAGVIAGRRLMGFHARQNATVSIESKRDETLRALLVIARAVMLRATLSFMKSGYVSIQYEGMDALGMDEMLVAEQLGIYTRHLRYSAEVEVEVHAQLPGVTLDDIAWFVQLDEVVADPLITPAAGAGVPGGVTHLDD